MERIKGHLGKDGKERYFKIIQETLDKYGLCNGYSVNFDYDIRKDKTVLSIFKFAHGVPIEVLIYNKFYCDGEPVITENTFEEEFEKYKHKFVT
jgi:hypothetical protein